jgi:NAD(P)-dependent dehydrogenase (short-subunit alcohol dehydrogenase family)
MNWLIYGMTKGRGSGLGLSGALLLSRRGHTVRGLCRSAEKAQAETRLPVEAVDICDEAGQSRIKEIIREFDPDVVWSACGTGFSGPLWALSGDEIEQTIDANIRNAVLFCQTCGPSCIDGGPHLILTGSTSGVLEGQGASLYAGTKGFLVPFLRSQRDEYRRQGHNPKLSLLALPPLRPEDVDTVVDALEYIGRQTRSVEVMLS